MPIHTKFVRFIFHPFIFLLYQALDRVDSFSIAKWHAHARTRALPHTHVRITSEIFSWKFLYHWHLLIITYQSINTFYVFKYILVERCQQSWFYMAVNCNTMHVLPHNAYTITHRNHHSPIMYNVKKCDANKNTHSLCIKLEKRVKTWWSALSLMLTYMYFVIFVPSTHAHTLQSA